MPRPPRALKKLFSAKKKFGTLLHKKGKPFHHMGEYQHKNIIRIGIKDAFWSDLYHNALTVSWPSFVLYSIIFYFVLNIIFSVLYALHPHDILNARPGHLEDFLFFSIQTFSTVGYGTMSPNGNYANTLVSFEVFAGMMINSLATGLIFARFSRPTARVLFSKNAVINNSGEHSALIVRFANRRRSVILSMDVEMSLSRLVSVGNGRFVRRFDPLPLVQSHSPILRFSATAVHQIDKISPLYGMKAEDLEKDEAEIIVTINGIDEVTSQNLFARNAYSFDAILINHHFVDIIGLTTDGRIAVDFSRFHHTETH